MELRGYQTDAVAAAWSFLCSQAGSPVICAPTGSGKSWMISQLCKDAVERFNGRVLVTCHRKELIVQDADKIRILLPGMDIGVYSAGLCARDLDHDIVVCGIQSVYKRALEFGSRQLVLADEAHLVPHDGEGMYRTFVNDLRSANPRLRMVGLTATPFRLDSGPLCRPDGIFQKICYSANIREMIADGWLCNLTTKPAEATIDTSGIRVAGGEFVSYESLRAFDQRGIVEASCQEIGAKTRDRKSVLIFCSGVSHAYHVKQAIESISGEPCGIVTGESTPLERGAALGDFKNRRLRFLVNIDVLSHGFDCPCIDAIAVLRATMSPGLFCQICGRGFRTHPEKVDGCLVLDFGENIKRHGPIDAIDYGKPKGHGNGHAGKAPTKTCPNCKQEVHLSARECECGWLFREAGPKHNGQADTQSEILSVPEHWIVEKIAYSLHEKKKGLPDASCTLRVDYECIPADGTGGNLERKTISEWICLGHVGFARVKAVRWWKQHSRAPVPSTVEAAVDLCQRGAVASAHHLVTRKERYWDRVLSYELDEKPEQWSDEAIGAVDPWDAEIPF